MGSGCRIFIWKKQGIIALALFGYGRIVLRLVLRDQSKFRAEGGLGCGVAEARASSVQTETFERIQVL
jgi:hypothetical protein